MKIGLSYSRCIRDIVDGRVNPDDVLIIISRTDFDPHNDEQWKSIWEGYRGRGALGTAREWAHYDEDCEQAFRDVTLNLWADGKLHQPRQFGARPSRRKEFWLEAVLPSEELDRNPAARDAWHQFQTVAGLTSVRLDHNYS